MEKDRSRAVTVDLVRRANRAAIEGKRYAPHIEAAAAKLPRLTVEEINRAWSRVNGRSEESPL